MNCSETKKSSILASPFVQCPWMTFSYNKTCPQRVLIRSHLQSTFASNQNYPIRLSVVAWIFEKGPCCRHQTMILPTKHPKRNERLDLCCCRLRQGPLIVRLVAAAAPLSMHDFQNPYWYRCFKIYNDKCYSVNGLPYCLLLLLRRYTSLAANDPFSSWLFYLEGSKRSLYNKKLELSMLNVVPATAIACQFASVYSPAAHFQGGSSLVRLSADFILISYFLRVVYRTGKVEQTY